jgi:hypothetical protein
MYSVIATPHACSTERRDAINVGFERTPSAGSPSHLARTVERSTTGSRPGTRRRLVGQPTDFGDQLLGLGSVLHELGDERGNLGDGDRAGSARVRSDSSSMRPALAPARTAAALSRDSSALSILGFFCLSQSSI